MYRRTQVNGNHSNYFPIRSGVAQGCPCSPILFLFVTEGLIRLIADHESYEGIVVNGTELRLSQFADDTVLLLRNYKTIPLIFDSILPNFELATQGSKLTLPRPKASASASYDDPLTYLPLPYQMASNGAPRANTLPP